jgi:hypothetical protein
MTTSLSCSEDPRYRGRTAAREAALLGRMAGGRGRTLAGAALPGGGAPGNATRRVQRGCAARAVGRPRRQELLHEHPPGAPAK